MKVCKLIKNKYLCSFLSASLALAPSTSYAATFQQANVINYDMYQNTFPIYQAIAESILSYVPDEVLLYHQKLGKTVTFIDKMPEYSYKNASLDPNTVIGAYTIQNGDIELLCPEISVTINHVLAPTHEFGHFIYYQSHKYWTKEMASKLVKLHQIMTKIDPYECYNIEETFAVVYANLKNAQRNIDTGAAPGFDFSPDITYDTLIAEYGDLFENAEDIIRRLYNEEEPEIYLKGPGDVPISNITKREDLFGPDISAENMKPLTEINVHEYDVPAL